MPAVSEKQRRFFGAMLGYKHGQLTKPSAALKKAAKGVTVEQARDFARKPKGMKHRGPFHHRKGA